MSAEMNATGTGAATGAATGAIAGSTLGPVGTVVGAGVGAVAGGAAGYISAHGAAKRKKALAEAQARYANAVAAHEAALQRIGVAQRAGLSALSNQSQLNMDQRLHNMPGDQTASSAHDAENQMAALQAAPTNASALSGPLADTYNQEAAKRTQTALTPMAHGYATDQQGQAFIQNENAYQNAQSATQPNATAMDQQLGLYGGQADSALSRAESDYGMNRYRAQNAGGEQMLYGAMLQQGLNLGAQGAMAYGGYQRRNAPALNPNQNIAMRQDSWNSRVPLNNPYGPTQA